MISRESPLAARQRTGAVTVILLQEPFQVPGPACTRPNTEYFRSFVAGCHPDRPWMRQNRDTEGDSGRLASDERRRRRRQPPHAAREVPPRVIQHHATGRPGRALHCRRASAGAVARSVGDRRGHPRLRSAARSAGTQRRAHRGAASWTAGHHARRDRQPLLQLRPPGDRAGRAHGDPGRRRGGDWRRRRIDQPDGARQRAESMAARTSSRRLHGDGRDRGSGRAALRRDARVAGRIRARQPAAHRARAGRRFFRSRDRADRGDARRPRQDDRRQDRRGTGARRA
jgi:hypothetical protein